MTHLNSPSRIFVVNGVSSGIDHERSVRCMDELVVDDGMIASQWVC